MKIILRIILLFFIVACTQSKQKTNSTSYLLFQDSFDVPSQGEYIENVIQLPPPIGLGYNWRVLPGGHIPVNWVYSDAVNQDNPKKGFWVIPPNSGYLNQGGRSRNSALFANIAIPAEAVDFDIEFKQYRSDNDPIAYILGAKIPKLGEGIEFGYQIQVPGTDSTTNDAYLFGALGETIVEEAAYREEWVGHKISVRGQIVKWTANNKIMAQNEITEPVSGYFGFRHSYERNTRYDDVVITIIK